MRHPKKLINKIIKLVRKFPNDMELGGKIRHLIHDVIFNKSSNDRD